MGFLMHFGASLNPTLDNLEKEKMNENPTLHTLSNENNQTLQNVAFNQ